MIGGMCSLLPHDTGILPCVVGIPASVVFNCV